MEAKNKNMESAELKHLGLVRIAAIQVLLTVSSFYEYAKNNSGPLKSTVGTVEGAVGTVLGPVYDKFKSVPDSFLVFFDNKVDEVAETFDKHAPSVAKQAASYSSVLINKVTEKAQSFVKEARTGGSKAAFKYAAMEYKGFLVISSVKAWTKLNQYKPINKVAHKALPVAANLSSKYNDLVKEMSKKGYPLVGYLPLVPLEELVQAYKKEYAVQQTDANKSSSDSDTD